jgi:hypothetical protein
MLLFCFICPQRQIHRLAMYEAQALASVTMRLGVQLQNPGHCRQAATIRLYFSLATYNIPNALDFPAVWKRLVPIDPDLFIAHSQGLLPLGCCGSHTWVARRISILTFCRAMRLLSRSCWKRKTKAMSAPLMFFFVDFGLFHRQCFAHDIKPGNLLK